MIKNALFIFLFILSSIGFSYSNEKEIKYPDEIIDNLFAFQTEGDESESKIITGELIDSANDCFTFNFNPEYFDNYAAKKKSNKAAQYKKYRNIGIGLLVPGVILFVSSFILMGVGAYLIVYTETSNTQRWSGYYSSVYGTPTYNTVTESYQPYQAIGIPMAASGGLFFCIGLPLMIVGIVNLVKSAKYKNKASLSKGFALNLNYNPFNESINFNAKFSF